MKLFVLEVRHESRAGAMPRQRRRRSHAAPATRAQLRRSSVLVAAIVGAAAAGSRSVRANTPDYFTGADTTNPLALDDGTNYSPAGIPTAASDVLVDSTHYNVASALLNTSSSLAFGSLNVTNTLGAVSPYAIVIQDASNTSTNTLTLGGGSNGVAPASTDALYVDANSTLTFNSSTATGVLNVALAGTGSTFDIAGMATINGNLSSGTLIKTGAGTLILGNTGSNGFTGGTTINAGLLQIATTNDLGPTVSNGATINGGALRIAVAGSGSFTSGRVLNIGASGGTVDVPGTGYESIILTSATGLTGSGTLNVNATSTTDTGAFEVYGVNAGFTGNINVARGTFGIGYNVGNGVYVEGTAATTITVGPGTLQFFNFLNGYNTNPIVLTDPTSAIYDGSGFTWNASGGITGTGVLNKNGAGLLRLLGTNTYTGGTSVNAGDLRFAAATAVPTGNISIGAATLDVSGYTAITISNPIILTDPASSIGIYNTSTYALGLSGVISGSGNLNIVDAGAVVLEKANTFTGNVNVSSGSLQFTTTSAIPTTATITLAQGTTLEYNNATAGVSLTRSLVLNGPGFSTFNVGSSSVTDYYAGTITGAGGFNKIGTFGLYLTNAGNTYSGGTNVSAGTLRSNVAGGTGTGPVTVFSGALLGGNGSVGAVTVSGTIGAGSSASTIGSLTTGLTTFNTANAAIKIDGNTAVASLGGLGDSGTPGVANDLLIITSLNTPSGTTTVTPSAINAGLTLGSNYSFAIAEIPAANLSSSVTTFATLAPTLAISSSFYYANATFQDDPSGDAAGDDLLIMSFTAAPEPTSLLLLGMATAPLARRRRRPPQKA
jgi:autotransporter-associated beta strand protein